jgi:hypothetical protein
MFYVCPSLLDIHVGMHLAVRINKCKRLAWWHTHSWKHCWATGELSEICSVLSSGVKQRGPPEVHRAPPRCRWARSSHRWHINEWGWWYLNKTLHSDTRNLKFYLNIINLTHLCAIYGCFGLNSTVEAHDVPQEVLVASHRCLAHYKSQTTHL